MKDCTAFNITEPSHVGEARRMAMAIATDLGFNETDRGKVGIVVTEVANNLVNHAKDGELLLRSLQRDQISGLEILALDSGPGMVNVSECLRDGFSTKGTPGTGLGAIARLSAFFDIHSVPEVGTAIVAHLWSKPLPTQRLAALEIGVVCLPKLGETVCGDAWAVKQESGRNLIIVADGLGHGPLAAEASQKAVQVFQENSRLAPKQILEAVHDALRSTRGAAVAIALIDVNQQQVRFAGVGNIAGSVITASESRSMVSYNGIVGYQVRKIQEFVYPSPHGAMLILHSDGLATQWRVDRYPGLAASHPSLIAGVLYRDFKRSRDDVTVLVTRQAMIL